MKNILNYFKSEEKVRLGGKTLIIEHSPLENLVGCTFVIVGGVITSPIWISVGVIYGLYSAGRYGYSKLKKKKITDKDKLGVPRISEEMENYRRERNHKMYEYYKAYVFGKGDIPADFPDNLN